MKIITAPVKSYIRKWAGKKSPIEMAVDLDVSKSLIVAHASRMNISLQKKDIIKSNKHIDKIITQHYKEMTPREMAALANVGIHRIRYRGYRRGIEFLREVAPPEKKFIKKGNSLLFDETHHENWLI